MKKSNKGVKNKKSLKQLKEMSESSFSEEDYENALLVNEKIILYYPKNIYGYLGVIKAKTHSYSCYINDKSLKKLKKTYEKSLEIASKRVVGTLKREFGEYVDDCKEVENLRRVKKEITGKELLKLVHANSISFINQNVSLANSYGSNGKRVKNFYDFINGLFFFSCLIFNLIYHNYLLFLTIPFGIFGAITIYSFIDMNFLKKGKIRSERERLKVLIEEADKKVSSLKEQIKKAEDNLEFLYAQKSETILRIPASFETQIKEDLESNEKKVASLILGKLTINNTYLFVEALERETTLNATDIENVITENLKINDDELSDFISDKMIEKKNNQSEVIYIKKPTTFNYVILIVLLIISIFSIIVLINNFYEINLASFIIACITGIISMLVYNINNGKHASLGDTFNDNLLSCIFNTALVYDLVYSSITCELKITYGFIQMPLIFILIFMGFVMLISLMKYNYLLKSLRK